MFKRKGKVDCLEYSIDGKMKRKKKKNKKEMGEGNWILNCVFLWDGWLIERK